MTFQNAMLTANAVIWGLMMAAAASEDEWLLCGVFAIFMLGNIISVAVSVAEKESDEDHSA